MGEHTERVRQFPRRESVRRIALVNERNGGNECFVREVGIERLHLCGEEESLIYNSTRGKRADIAAFECFFDIAADYIELAFIGTGHKELANARQNTTGDRPDRLGNDGDFAPTQHRGTICRDGILKNLLFADRAKHHRDTIPALLRQVRHNLTEEAVGNLHEETRAIACLRVIACRATVHEPFQHGQARLHDFARRHIVQIRH